MAQPDEPDLTAEGLIRATDTAVSQAKDAGRDAVVMFDRGMHDRVFQRLTLQRDLRHALQRDELSLHYQPIIDLPSGRVSGFEALLRWSHPTWGQVAPLLFIPVAEATGLIVEIGAGRLEQASAQRGRWPRDRRVPGCLVCPGTGRLRARRLSHLRQSSERGKGDRECLSPHLALTAVAMNRPHFSAPGGGSTWASPSISWP